MFNIIKKLRPIHIDAFTYSEEIYNFYYPKSSSDCIPKWWKALPATFSDTKFSQVQISTMKRCTGVIEIFKHGFIIPLWSDLAINLQNTNGLGSYNYQFSDGVSCIEAHPAAQFEGFTNVHQLQHLKLITPWKMREKTGMQFMFTQPTWHMQNLNGDVTVLPGIIDLKYQDSVNVQLLLKYPKHNLKTSLLLHADTPLYQVVPLSDRPIKITTHLIDRVKYEGMGNSAIKFNGNYFQRKKMIDKQPTCPFKKWL